MKWLPLVSALLALGFCSTAAARVGAITGQHAGLPRPITVTADDRQYETWARGFRVPLPRAHVHATACPEGGGTCVMPDGSLWVPRGGGQLIGRFALAHELGHVFDRQTLTDADRAWFATILHAKPGAWSQGTGLSGGRYVAAELFADAYATCAIGLWPGNGWIDGYGYSPTRREHRRVCMAIQVLGQIRTAAPTPTGAGS